MYNITLLWDNWVQAQVTLEVDLVGGVLEPQAPSIPPGSPGSSGSSGFFGFSGSPGSSGSSANVTLAKVAASFRELLDKIQTADILELLNNTPPDMLTTAKKEACQQMFKQSGHVAASREFLRLLASQDNWLERLQAFWQHNHSADIRQLAKSINSLIARMPLTVEMDQDEDGEDSVGEDTEPGLQRHRRRLLAQVVRTFFVDMARSAEQEGCSWLGQIGNYAVRWQHLIPPQIKTQRFLAHVEKLTDARPDGGLERAVREVIIGRFFLSMARSPSDVERLTRCFQRIMNAMTVQVALGCLLLRLQIDKVADLVELQRVVESGLLREMIELELLGDRHRKKLDKLAAAYGMKWRQQMTVTITMPQDDFRRCETFLKVSAEIPNPKSPAEALLQKAAAQTGGDSSSHPWQPDTVPRLLLRLLDWLLVWHPDLAESLAPILVSSSLERGLTETMATCRRFFSLSNEHEKDLAEVLSEMLRNAEADSVPFPKSPLAEVVEGLPASLVVEALLGTRLTGVMKRLRQAGLLTRLPGEVHAFRFSSPFVQDFSFTCLAHAKLPEPHTGYVSKALQYGSPLAFLHFVDLMLSLSLPDVMSQSALRADERFTRGQPGFVPANTLAQELVQPVLNNDCHVQVVEMYMACFKFVQCPDIARLFRRCWTTFGRDWKTMAAELLASGRSGGLPDILLGVVPNGEKQALTESAGHVLSGGRSIDLTRKLDTLGPSSFRVLLNCAQLSNVARFGLIFKYNCAALRFLPGRNSDITSNVRVDQPALELSHNALTDALTEPLVNTLPELEAVPLMDLTGCTLTQHNLQRILDSAPVTCLRSLILNGVRLPGGPAVSLPRFCHLKRLKTVDLGSLALRDEHMPELSRQLLALHGLRELSLEQNAISTAGLSLLTPALASRSLRALNLSHCPLEAGAAFVLGAILTSSLQLHELSLSHCPLQDSGLQHLALALRDHTQLTRVSLRSGRYTPQGLASFLAHLAKCSRMEHLDIGQCPLKKDGYDISDKLVQALAGSRQWDYLGLWQCQMGYTGFLKKLHYLAPQLCRVTKLVLQDNDLDDESICDLLGHKLSFRHLRHLNLGTNAIKAQGAYFLADELHSLPSLEELLLQNCAIPADAAVGLSRAVLGMRCMKFLDLSCSQVMDYGEAQESCREIADNICMERVCERLDHLCWDCMNDDDRYRLGPLPDETRASDKRLVQQNILESSKHEHPSHSIFKTPPDVRTMTRRDSRYVHFRRSAAKADGKGHVIVDDELHINLWHD